jgi:hypothetical protein
VGPRAILDMVVKRKIPSPLQELNPKTLIIQPIAQPIISCKYKNYMALYFHAPTCFPGVWYNYEQYRILPLFHMLLYNYLPFML